MFFLKLLHFIAAGLSRKALIQGPRKKQDPSATGVDYSFIFSIFVSNGIQKQETMKRLMLSLLLFAFAVNISAEEVDLKTAKSIAITAYCQKLNQYHAPAAPEQLQITEQYVIARDGAPVLYVFNFLDYGYIIMAAEDVLNPVQAYSFTSSYDPGHLPCNFRGWLDGRAGAAAYARENNVVATPEVASRWTDLQKGETLDFEQATTIPEPLMTETWNQDWPENYYMPLDPSGPGGRCLVGCVATAMAQIMHYWRYPLQGSGIKTHSFGPYPPITVNYGATDYDWDAMLDNSDDAVNLAMAEISMHAAVSVNMEWGPETSAAYSSDVPPAMQDYFTYNPTSYYVQNQGSNWTTWKNYIHAELEDLRPVYYAGSNTSGEGHAFVCDGYNSDGLYHFNFGWSGAGNGWFDITSPSGYEWYYTQAMIRFLYPADPGYPYGCSSIHDRNTLVGSFEDGSGPQQDYEADASCSWLISPQTEKDSVVSIDLEFVFIDTAPGDVVILYDGPTEDHPVLGTYSGSETPSGLIQSTRNQVLVSFQADGDENKGSGWKLQYYSRLPSYCSSSPQLLTEPAGTVSDGSGDFWYINNTHCIWKIAPDSANGLTLSFSAFETEKDEDILRVYDASNSQLLGEFSGTIIPDPVFVESGELYLIWKTSAAIPGPGWKAGWIADNVGIPLEQDNLIDLTLHPNPASGSVTLSFSTKEEQTVTIRLISPAGELLQEERISTGIGGHLKRIDTSSLARGIYFISITAKEGNSNHKLVVL